MPLAAFLSAFLRRTTARSLTFDGIDARGLPAPCDGRDYTLYMHVPFCEQLCPYCTFNRYPFQERAARAYFRDLRAELRMVHDAGYRFSWLYIGGGTPTVQMDELVSTIDLATQLFGRLEVSCETNPNHLTAERLAALSPRVHRLSVGVQSFDDDLLRQMRRHDAYGSGAEALARVRSAAGSVPVLNIDLIYNFPGQTADMLDRDIDLAGVSQADQVTCYPLMPAANGARVSARSQLARQNNEERFYQQIARRLQEELTPTSAWCFSRESRAMIDEYILDSEEYVGVGAGAFSYLDGTLYANAFSLPAYARAVQAGRHSALATRRFSARDRMRYSLLMGLFGLHLDRGAFERRHGQPVERALPVEMTFLLLARAFEADRRRVITLTPRGRYLVVAMMREFFVAVNGLRDQARALLSTTPAGAEIAG